MTTEQRLVQDVQSLLFHLIADHGSLSPRWQVQVLRSYGPSGPDSPEAWQVLLLLDGGYSNREEAEDAAQGWAESLSNVLDDLDWLEEMGG